MPETSFKLKLFCLSIIYNQARNKIFNFLFNYENV